MPGSKGRASCAPFLCPAIRPGCVRAGARTAQDNCLIFLPYLHWWGGVTFDCAWWRKTLCHLLRAIHALPAHGHGAPIPALPAWMQRALTLLVNRFMALTCMVRWIPANVGGCCRYAAWSSSGRGEGFPFHAARAERVRVVSNSQKPVTFFVGENGCGKSTLLEIIGVCSQASLARVRRRSILIH